MLFSHHIMPNRILENPPMTAVRLASLNAALPTLRLLTDPANLEHYGRDWTRRWTPAPLAIALPASVDEVHSGR